MSLLLRHSHHSHHSHRHPGQRRTPSPGVPTDRVAATARAGTGTRALAAAALLLAAAAAPAQVFQDPALQALLSAERHYALGTVLGVHAMGQGMVKMASSVGTVKASLLESLRLAPLWYPARSAVVEFYLQAPGLIGGSTAKATEAARTAAKPEQARALEARVALDDERFDAALAGLYGVQPGTDSARADDVQQWTAQAGFGLLGKGDAAKARPVFEQAAKLKGAAQLPVDYRLGLALQAQGQTEPARAAYARFVAAGRGQGKSLDDAKKRLAQLGGPTG